MQGNGIVQKNLSSKLIITKFSQTLWHNFWIVVFISCDFSNKKVDCFGYFFHAAITLLEWRFKSHGFWSWESSHFLKTPVNSYNFSKLTTGLHVQSSALVNKYVLTILSVPVWALNVDLA